MEVQRKSERHDANSGKMGTPLIIYSHEAGPHIYLLKSTCRFFVCTRFNADNKVLQIAGCSALPLEQGTADCRVLDKQMMLSLLEGKSAAQPL